MTERRLYKIAHSKCVPRSGENRLLASLTADDVATLRPHLRQVELRRGNVLHEPRAAIERVYFPLSGTVLMLVGQKPASRSRPLLGRDRRGGSAAHPCDRLAVRPAESVEIKRSTAYNTTAWRPRMAASRSPFIDAQCGWLASPSLASGLSYRMTFSKELCTSISPL